MTGVGFCGIDPKGWSHSHMVVTEKTTKPSGTSNEFHLASIACLDAVDRAKCNVGSMHAP
jgi:hypothetical protein